MQAYIKQLLEDIENAHQKEITSEDLASLPTTIEEELEEIERRICEDPVHTFGYYCGLEKEQFPPENMLSKNQIRQLTRAFVKLLNSWNMHADFPEYFPLNKKYMMLTQLLNEKTIVDKFGFTFFDFCNGYPPSCPLGEFCNCKKMDAAERKNKKTVPGMK